MGLPDIYSITVEGAKNFRAAIESEERASWAWMGKWGWILDEYKAINRELAQLKEGRIVEEAVTEIEDNRTTRPYSETEGHEYGFLTKKPEFRLEIFSSPGLTPLPKTLHPAQFYKLLDELMEEKMKKKKI
ncbi:unnamed protein product [Nezara viridula]|uniref:Uncharacterized protein n=1 Tax=Nezara viridula TaxID=85310 RepID=A0A9P0MRQ6_NEZVI|nr:unnamed protein product [Nezara viridula]